MILWTSLLKIVGDNYSDEKNIIIESEKEDILIVSNIIIYNIIFTN